MLDIQDALIYICFMIEMQYINPPSDGEMKMETLKQQLIEEGIEAVKTTARVFEIGNIEAYRMWLKTTVAGPAVKSAVKEAVTVKPLDNYYTAGTYNTEDLY